MEKNTTNDMNLLIKPPDQQLGLSRTIHEVHLTGLSYQRGAAFLCVHRRILERRSLTEAPRDMTHLNTTREVLF